MPSKVTIFINAAVQGNNPDRTGTEASAAATTRLGGITENWYADQDYNSQSLWDLARTYATARAKLLPNVCAVVALRFKQYNEKKKVFLLKETFAGSADTIADIPQMALDMTFHSRTTGAERKFRLGAVPDARVSRGSYLPSQAFQNNLNAFAAIVAGNFKMRATDQTVPTTEILTVSEAGLVTTNVAHGLVTGDIAQVMSTRDFKYRAVSGNFKVLSAPTTTTLTLENWDAGICTKGKIRKHLWVLELVQAFQAELNNPTVAVRKFGRPFDLFRGRASTKR